MHGPVKGDIGGTPNNAFKTMRSAGTDVADQLSHEVLRPGCEISGAGRSHTPLYHR